MQRFLSWILLLLAVVAGMPAATLPSGFAESQIATGLDPTAMAIAPDGRVFIAEKAGRIRVVVNDVLLSTPFAVLANVYNINEAGLDGICLHPNFASNGWIYAFYTTTTPSPTHNRIVRFTANGNVAAGAPTTIFALEGYGGAHNGGAMHFGPDGKLYVGTGDLYNSALAPSLTSLQGKILRLNEDGTIPGDNPFAGSTSGIYRAIWARGLRNPFTAAFQPGTNRFYINDVGGSAWEEINLGTAGANFGWPATEGNSTNSAYTNPVYAYDHSQGCAIAGGVFYNPTTAQFPTSYVGRYFFADYCNNWVRSIDPAATNPGASMQTFATGLNRPVDLDVAPNGSLYYLARGGLGGGSIDDNTSSTNGTLWRVSYTASQAPSVAAQPQNVTVTVGGSATFIVSASGAPPLTYQWQRNSTNIPGATGTSYTVSNAQPADNGALFRVRISNPFDSVTSASAVLTVTSNQPPVASITTPVAGTTWSAGTSITYGGSASDTEDGTIPASGLTWRIDLHHDDHHHPVMAPTTGISGGTLVIPAVGETSPNLWYRFTLKATDSTGLTHTTVRDIHPRTAQMTFRTVPAGLTLELDGAPIADGTVVTGVVGRTRRITAPTQTVGGTTWGFSAWSDGGAFDHEIATPMANTTYTATFTSVPVGNGTGLSASYWNNLTLTGTPALTRVDAGVNFNWAAGSPGAGVAIDNISARWTGEVQAQVTQTYTFHVVGDDGVRLRVNGQLLVDRWVNQDSVEWSGSIALVAGQRYPIELEWYDHGGNAVVRLLWSGAGTSKQAIPASQLYPTGGNGTGLTGEYFTNSVRSFTGAPALVRTDSTVDFAWAAGSPAAGISADWFTARWIGQVQAPSTGNWTFTVTGDDGVRLWVNGQQIINRWIDQAPTEASGTIALTAGAKVDIRLEYYEAAGGALVKLEWSGPGQPRQIVPRARLFPAGPPPALGTGLAATYWDAIDFTGPSLSRTDATVDFAWGAGSPAASIAPDTFSARWTGQVEAPVSGSYTFHVLADDGVRLWVDGQLVVNRWVDQPATEASGSITLTAGQRYDITLEYYEKGGQAEVRLRWTPPGGAKATVPQGRLYPSPTGFGWLPTGGTPVLACLRQEPG